MIDVITLGENHPKGTCAWAVASNTQVPLRTRTDPCRNDLRASARPLYFPRGLRGGVEDLGGGLFDADAPPTKGLAGALGVLLLDAERKSCLYLHALRLQRPT